MNRDFKLNKSPDAFFVYVFFYMSLGFLLFMNFLGFIAGGNKQIMIGVFSGMFIFHYIFIMEAIKLVSIANLEIKADGQFYISTIDILFRRKQLHISIQEIQEMEIVGSLLFKSVIFKLQSGEALAIQFDRHLLFNNSRSYPCFSFDNENYVDVARTLGLRHENVLSKLVIQIVNQYRKGEQNK